MTWLWIPITVFAAFVQTVRTAAQKHLTAELTVMSATLVRFLFGLPFAALYLYGLLRFYGRGLPPLEPTFLAYCFAAAVSQIIATFLLIHLFSLRNFAVGTTYARTEAFLTAVIGALFFGEAIVLLGWIAILVSVAGVVLITVARTGLKGRQLFSLLGDRAAWIGVVSGAGFAVASLSIRRASLSFGDPTFLYTAAVTLVTVIVIQTVALTLYLVLRDARQFLLMMRNWRVCVLVGITSMLGSTGWFTAMTIEKASYVKALAQVEFIFTLAASMWFFKERSTRKELAGMVLVVVGIVMLLTLG